ncbi:MAG: hypothetical protein ABIP14_04100 [Blastocatellia bacterium]
METEGVTGRVISKTVKIRPVTGVFNNLDAAESAYAYLTNNGYNHDEVSVVMSEEARTRLGKDSAIVSSHNESEVPHPSDKVAGGMGKSSAVGALSGLVAAAGISLVVPGFGLIVLGPLAGLGAGLGAALGAIFGIPFGVTAETESKEPQEKADADYEAHLRQGRVLLSVEPRSAEDQEKIQREWDRINANINTSGA